MPIHINKDENGYYAQWGNHGKRYYFNKNKSGDMARAYKKAQKQSAAAHAHGYRGH